MDNNDLLAYGINVPNTIAGLAGGICAPLAMRNASPMNVFSSVVAGGLCANYMTTEAATYLGVKEGLAGFLVGISALIIVQAILLAAKRFKPTLPKG
jgi:hypothetical protein